MVKSTDQYDAWGNLLAGGDASDPYGYKGKFGYYTDHETGLVLCTHRYYDPIGGKWINRDPIGISGGINLYRYCNNNPISNDDPSGLTHFNPGGYSDYSNLTISFILSLSIVTDQSIGKNYVGIGLGSPGISYTNGIILFPGHCTSIEQFIRGHGVSSGYFYGFGGQGNLSINPLALAGECGIGIGGRGSSYSYYMSNEEAVQPIINMVNTANQNTQNKLNCDEDYNTSTSNQWGQPDDYNQETQDLHIGL